MKASGSSARNCAAAVFRNRHRRSTTAGSAAALSTKESRATPAASAASRSALRLAREADPADAGEPDFVYRSRYLHEVEMVCEHLEREGLAFYQSEEAMGVRYAMPAAAAVATLPGAWFLVIVPAAHAERAAEIVDALPISHGDDDEPATDLAGV